MTAVVGAAHEAGVERLLDSYRAIPPGERVRLAKRTSNLFRAARRQHRARPRRLGPDRGRRGRPRRAAPPTCRACAPTSTSSTPRCRTGSPPLVVPQLQDHHPRRRGHRARHRVDVVPQRPAARVGARDGRAHRGGRGRHGGRRAAPRRPLPRLPQLLRHARLRHPAADRARAGRAASSRCGTCASTTSTSCVAALGPRSSPTGATTASAVDYLDGVVFSATESYLTLGPAQRRAGPDQRLHRAARSTTGRSSTTAAPERDRLTTHDYLWRWDTDWFWCSRAFGAQNPRVRRLWPRRWLRSSVYWKLVALDRRFGVADRLEARKGRPPRERVVQDVEVPLAAHRRVPALVPARGADRADLAVPVAAARRATGSRPWPLYPLRPARPTSTSGSGRRVPSDPAAGPGATNRRIEHEVTALGGHKSLYSDVVLRRGRVRRLYGGDDYAALKQPVRPRWPAARPLRQGGAAEPDRTRPPRTRHDARDQQEADVHRRDRRVRHRRAAAAAAHRLRRQPRPARPTHRAACTCARPARAATSPPPRATSGWPGPTSPATSTSRACTPATPTTCSSTWRDVQLRRPPPRAAASRSRARSGVKGLTPAAAAAAGGACPAGGGSPRGCGTRRPATPRRSATTTTSPTASTRWSSARR